MSKEFIVKQTNKSLVDFYTKSGIGQTIDYLNPDLSKMTKSSQKIGFEWRYVDFNDYNIGKLHTVKIPRSDGYVSNQMLEITLPAGTYYGLPAILAIREVQVYIGQEIIKYDRKTLLNYLLTINKNEQKDELKILMGGKDSTVFGAAQTVYLPLLGPGNNCLIGEHQIPFKIGATAYDYEYKIIFEAYGQISSTLSSNAMTRIRLMYKNYIGSDLQNNNLINTGFDVNVENSNIPIATYPHLITKYNNYAKTFSGTTAYEEIPLNGINLNGDLLFLMVSLTLASKEDTPTVAVSAFSYVDETNMKYKVSNYDLYKHESSYEARYLHLKNWGTQNYDAMNSSGTTGTHFCIPFTVDMKDSIKYIGGNGINIQELVPVLSLYGPTAAAYYVHVAAFYNADINIQKNGYINVVSAYDLSVLPPISKPVQK